VQVTRFKTRQAKNFGNAMTRIAILLFFLTGVTTIGLIILANWQIPAPSVVINKVVSDENFPK
jgi:hypothetical protein